MNASNPEDMKEVSGEGELNEKDLNRIIKYYSKSISELMTENSDLKD